MSEVNWTDTRIIVKTNASLLLQSGDGGNQIKIPFGFGDATPKVITQVTGVIYRAAIVILQPFNGTVSSLRLGDSQQLDRLITSSQLDCSTVAEYEVNPQIKYVQPTQILLSIQLGEGVTQGAGVVFLEFN